MEARSAYIKQRFLQSVSQQRKREPGTGREPAKVAVETYEKVYFSEVLKIHTKKPSQTYQNTLRIYTESEWTFAKAFVIILAEKS